MKQKTESIVAKISSQFLNPERRTIRARLIPIFRILLTSEEVTELFTDNDFPVNNVIPDFAVPGDEKNHQTRCFRTFPGEAFSL
jgi:anion-transporting  ArsA/GET3 family ATPase